MKESKKSSSIQPEPAFIKLDDKQLDEIFKPRKAKDTTLAGQDHGWEVQK
jgi:hypothetical protein